MKKIIRLDQIIIISIGILSILFIVIWVNRYIDDSKLKITDDISASDTTLLQKEFSIDLPAQAQITAFGYSTDLVVIRIEGVEDLPVFLTDTIHLELDANEMQTVTDNVYYGVEHDASPEKDMYGIKHKAFLLYTSNYQTDPIHRGIMATFFLIDGKLAVEISKPDTTSENREAIKEIVGA